VRDVCNASRSRNLGKMVGALTSASITTEARSHTLWSKILMGRVFVISRSPVQARRDARESEGHDLISALLFVT
jgi:hypothetical protein